jgi:hypothetical protein
MAARTRFLKKYAAPAPTNPNADVANNPYTAGTYLLRRSADIVSLALSSFLPPAPPPAEKPKLYCPRRSAKIAAMIPPPPAMKPVHDPALMIHVDVATIPSDAASLAAAVACAA